MYEQYYGFREKPFNLTPDPSFLFLSEKHKEAFAHLLYGIRNRTGFIMVTGEIGTGKTTICRSLLSRLDPETEIAFIFNPILSAEELLRTINQDFGIDSKGVTIKDLLDELNAYLLQRAAAGKNCVLVIDEAQNLDPKVLEQVRLLSNLETETQKLLQIVLIGQPELAQMLASKELRQLNQRITARYHLKELDADETLHYIAFRLRVAGGRRKVRFSRSAVMKVYRHSKGTPRVINAVCDRALLIGYTQETREITPAMVKQAISEIQGEKVKLRKPRERALIPPAWSSTAALLMMGAFLYFIGSNVVIAPRQASAPSTAIAPEVAPPRPEPRIVEAAPAVARPPAQDDVVVADAVQPLSPINTIEAGAESLAAIPEDSARSVALNAVLKAWGKEPADEIPVGMDTAALTTFARAHGFKMSRIAVSPDELFAVNLPAIVTLKANQVERPVAVVSREEPNVKVAFAPSGTIAIHETVFAEAYAGDAIYLWVDPNPNVRDAVPWQSGDHVRAVQERLNAIGLTARVPTGKFDADTVDLVKKVQEAAGLEIDGVVGEQTRMVLTSWDASAETPALCSPALPEIAISRLFGLLVQSAESQAPEAPRVAAVQAPASAASPLPQSEPHKLEDRIGSQATIAVSPEVAPALPAISVETLDLGIPGTALLQPDEDPSSRLVTEPAGGHIPLIPRSMFGEVQAP